MMSHNISFKGVLWEIAPKLSLLPFLSGALISCAQTILLDVGVHCQIFIQKETVCFQQEFSEDNKVHLVGALFLIAKTYDYTRARLFKALLA